MAYADMTKEKLIEAIGARKAELDQVREAIEMQKNLTRDEFRALRFTYCRECNERLIDEAGCKACAPARKKLVEYMRSNGNR